MHWRVPDDAESGPPRAPGHLPPGRKEAAGRTAFAPT